MQYRDPLQVLVGEEVGHMKRILMFMMVLLAISVVTPGIAHASATFTEIDGTFSMTASNPGTIHFLKSGIMVQVGAVASGPSTCSDPRLTGTLQIELYVIFNLNTGEGNGFGSFTISNAGGIFEGRFTVKDTGYVFFAGKMEGHGRAGYEGLLVKIDMAGIDLYRDADQATNGIDATFTGYILSPHGA
jgi:hypothetical protein